MTGFDSLSGDILSAAADKMAARDSKKGQMPGAKTGDKASRAFRHASQPSGAGA